MKKLLIGLLLLSVSAHANSPYVGKLDLSSLRPDAIVFRELNDGMWLVGAKYQAWHLEDSRSGKELFNISGFWAQRLEQQSTAYGASVGVNVGEAAHAALQKVELVAPLLSVNVPPWISKVSSWVSLDLFGGYRPSEASDQHHWIYGVGGKVSIPLDQAWAWAKGPTDGKGL